MIPAAYQEVEYIETYGAQYATITANLQNGDTLSASILVPSSAGSSEAAYVGADHSTGKAELYHQSNVLKFWGSFSGSDISIQRNTVYDVSAGVTGSLSGIYVGTYQPARYFFTGRIYAVSAERSGVTLFNLIPCYRINDDVIGFYDDVNAVFYTNDGSGNFGKGPDVVTDFYTLVFHAGAGSGTMPDQTVLCDTYDYINACAFTYPAHDFAGWATSAGGSAVYSDGAQIYNLGESGDIINLYATWETIQLRCILQYNKSENNRAVKDLEDIRSFNFKLKDPTSITDPVLLINGNITDLLNANYLTIPMFGRSYFINEITSVKNNLVEISAHVDVLSSYIEQLKTCEAIIHRQENKWNLYLDDGFFKTYQNPRIGVTAFPSGFTTQNFVLAVAGD